MLKCLFAEGNNEREIQMHSVRMTLKELQKAETLQLVMLGKISRCEAAEKLEMTVPAKLNKGTCG
jgi:hypothetical protein